MGPSYRRHAIPDARQPLSKLTSAAAGQRVVVRAVRDRTRTNVRELLALATLTALLVAFLWPTVRLPYLGDDMMNAYIDGWIGYEHLSVTDAFVRFISSEAPQGRFYPFFALLVFSLYHGIHNLAITKLLVLGACIANAATLYALLRLLAPPLALPTIALLPATWQIRYFHDPIIQFSLHMQLAAEFVLLALIGLALYRNRGSGVFLFLGAAAFTGACLTYEPTYAFGLLFVALVPPLVNGVRRRLIALAAFVGPVLACATVAFSFRARYPLPADDQHAVHLALTPIAHTLALQSLGSIPMVYRLLNPDSAFGGMTPSFRTSDLAIGTIAFLALALAYGAATPPLGERCPESLRFPVRRTILFALLAWLLSGIVIACSPRWQATLLPGLAYLPVYFAEPAVAVILAAIGLQTVRIMPRAAFKLIVPLVGATSSR